ncbi:MAG: SCO family protein [Candidatus Korobacteraceae bacterium]
MARTKKSSGAAVATTALFCVAVVLAGCAKKPAGKRYELQGRVVAVDSGSREITVAHEDIPGLMPGMTMPFQVAHDEDWIFGKIAPGDHIFATLVISDHAELQDISFTKTSDTESDGTSKVRIPQPGDPVPDFTFVNQSGRRVGLSQFRGRPLLLTFIYTRCPVPDFCLLMSNNFSEVLRELQATPSFEKAQLLSISIDPEYDRPPILREYGKRYVGKVDPDFQHWEFVTGTPQEVRSAADFFGLSYNQNQGQIVHTLRTVLIGSDGKIVRVYSGNQWKPSEVVRDYVAAEVEGNTTGARASRADARSADNK